MPQKKNPDLLEYLRGKSSNTYGNLFSMLTILKGLPLSYFKDLQEDKELIFRSNDTLVNCLGVFDEILKNFNPNKKQMLKLAKLERKQESKEAWKLRKEAHKARIKECKAGIAQARQDFKQLMQSLKLDGQGNATAA